MKLKNSAKTIALFFTIILLIIKSPLVLEGAYNGLMICVSSVIPALFPFMVISSAFVGSVNENSFKHLSYVTQKLFGLSTYGTGAFICGVLCGYPIGAKCAVELFKEGKISSSEAESLIAYSNNSGPLFVIGAVGIGMLHSYKAGMILYLVNIFWAIAFAMILKPCTYTKHIFCSQNFKNKELTTCICESVTNMLNVCGFIVFFYVVNAFLKPWLSFFSPILRSVCFSFVEITNGISYISKESRFLTDKVMLISLALGWSGLSVHMQVKHIAKGTNLSFKKYYSVRIAIALLSFITTAVWAGKADTVVYLINMNVLRIVLAGISVMGILVLIFYKRAKQKRTVKKVTALLRS